MASRTPARILAFIGAATFVMLLLHIGIGSYKPISPIDVLRELFAGPGHLSENNSIVWDLRLPRAVMCLCVGGLLGVVGSSFQALLRNPLADPYIVGVSSGSAVGGSLAIVLGLGSLFGGLGVAVFGFVTGILTLALVYSLSYKRGAIDVRTLLLAGVVAGSLLSAIQSLILLAAGKDESQVLRWLLGNTSVADWPKCAVVGFALICGSAVLLKNAKVLNAFAYGGDTAQRLGVNVPRLTKIILVTGAGMTAAAVSSVGIIGFLGLVAPHIARRILGIDWRWSLPGSLAMGSCLLLISDLIAQRGLSSLQSSAGIEIPVGVVTAILGAPALLVLLKKVG